MSEILTADWLERVGHIIPPNLYAPAVFVVWVLTLWLVKSILVRRLKKWAQKTSYQWDDILIEALSFPSNFLIFASGVTVLTRLLPLSEKIDRFVVIALQGSIVLAVVIFLDNLIKGALKELSSKKNFSEMSQGLTKAIARGIVMGIGALIFLDLIGISITPIIASLGIGSVAVALALQETLSNLFAGLYVSIDKPVRVGEYVKLDSGVEGCVMDVGWRSTRIRTLSNNLAVVPNAKLMSSIITNYYLPDKEMAVTIEMGVHSESDLEKVEKTVSEVSREILKKVPGAVPTFEPFIHFHAFGESSINFTVVLRCQEFTNQGLIRHEFIKAVHRRFKKENIIVPYPTRTLDISETAAQSLRNVVSKS